jgi:type II secretion system protein G
MRFRQDSTGFTIVELLIVIVVIGILAAIVIVSYNGITNSARETTIQNDLTNAKKKIMLYKVENTTYPTDATQLNSAVVSASKSAYDTVGNNLYYCYNRVTDEFAFGARTISNTSAYVINSLGGLQKVPNVTGDVVCQSIGLTAWNDPNGYISNGYNSSSGWQGWVK